MARKASATTIGDENVLIGLKTLEILQILPINYEINSNFIQACNFIKKRLLHRCFPVNIEKLLRIAFFIEHSWWLLLNFLQSLLKITMKKIIPQQSFAQKFLSHYFLVLAAMFLKITPLQVFGSFFLSLNMSEAYLEPNQTSKMEPFAKIVNKSRDIFRMESNI